MRKIIAREGLFLLAPIIGVVFLVLSMHHGAQMEKLLQVFNDTRISGWGAEYASHENNYHMFHGLGISFIALYAGAMLIRFVVWAVRVLRGK